MTSPSTPICESTLCKKAASKLLYLMNHNADPCQDFFDFACGGQKVDEKFTERENLKALIQYLERVDKTSEEYLYSFKKFYKSCVDYEQNFKFSQGLKFCE